MGSTNKYPIGIEKYLPAIKQIALERVNWYAKMRLDMALFREGNAVEQLSLAAEEAAFDLSVSFYAPGIQKQVVLSAPANWWSHFKASWPLWLRKLMWYPPFRWIVKPPLWLYESHNIGDIYPGLTLPDRYGHMVFYDMTKYRSRWSKFYDAKPGRPKLATDVRPKGGALADLGGSPAGIPGRLVGWEPHESVTSEELREQAGQEIEEALGGDLE